ASTGLSRRETRGGAIQYGFDTHSLTEATAALCVYAVWRSRDRARFRITPEVWSQAERFVKASAKRARNVPEFLEAVKPRFACGTIHPRAMAVGIKGTPTLTTERGEILELGSAVEEQREFLTGVLARVNQRAVVDLLYKQTAYIILL